MCARCCCCCVRVRGPVFVCGVLCVSVCVCVCVCVRVCVCSVCVTLARVHCADVSMICVYPQVRRWRPCDVAARRWLGASVTSSTTRRPFDTRRRRSVRCTLCIPTAQPQAQTQHCATITSCCAHAAAAACTGTHGRCQSLSKCAVRILITITPQCTCRECL